MVEPRGAVTDPNYDWGVNLRETFCTADHDTLEGEPCPVCRACL